MDPMNDSLDAEIRRALAVAPSPEFLARVRTRIAAEAAPASRRWGWMFAGVAAALAGVVLAVALSPRLPGTRPAGSPAVLGAKSTTQIGLLVPAPRTAAPNHQAPSRPRAAQPREPEVLIAVDEARATRALILGVRDGRIDLAAAVDAAPVTAAPSPPIDEIQIPLITITPIAPFSGEEGVPQ